MGRRKMWWVGVPCTMMSSSIRRSLRAESVKDIVKAKLATIEEEDHHELAVATAEEGCLNPPSLSRRLRRLAKKGKTAKIRSKTVMGRLFLPRFTISLKQVSL